MRLSLSQLQINLTCCIGVLLVIAASGCSSSGVQVGTVTGRITKNGKPQSQLLVYLTPLDHGRGSQGVTDENGHYQMVYTRDIMGALVGKHRFLITTPIKGDSAQGTELFSKEVEVQSGPNTFDFDLAENSDQKAK